MSKEMLQNLRKENLMSVCMGQDWGRILSMCRGTIHKLKLSGDYPEEQSDKNTVGGIIDIKYFVDKLKE